MKRLSLLLIAASVIAVSAAASTVVLSGVLAQPQDRNDHPGRLELREVTVTAGSVSADTVTLSVDAYLDHEGEALSNVSVVYRAIDGDSGFLHTVTRTELGEVAKDGETVVNQNLSVERAGSYRLEVLVYQGGNRIAAGGKRVAGLDALVPPYARSTVRFHQFERQDMPTVEYSIAETNENRTTLDTSIYLTNRGSASSEGLRVELTARQAESNIVADRETLYLDRIQPGETVTPSVNLSVPSGYNYYLDAILWKDGVVIGTARSAANLDPTRQLSINETVRDVNLEVSDFQQGSGPSVDRPEPTPAEPPGSGTQTPGFGIGAAIAAVLAVSVLARRVRNE